MVSHSSFEHNVFLVSSRLKGVRCCVQGSISAVSSQISLRSVDPFLPYQHVHTYARCDSANNPYIPSFRSLIYSSKLYGVGQPRRSAADQYSDKKKKREKRTSAVSGISCPLSSIDETMHAINNRSQRSAPGPTSFAFGGGTRPMSELMFNKYDLDKNGSLNIGSIVIVTRLSSSLV